MSAQTPARPLPSPLAEVPWTDRAAGEPTPALALCWHCGATSDRLDPPGWVTVSPAHEPGVAYTSGVCPACLADRYTFPWSREID
jgi:hypothetical protein